MKKVLSIFVFAALMLAWAGCDKIDINNIHKPYTPTGGGKTVLIKDFTGVRCVNCPGAAEVAHEIQHSLGEDRVFIMSVHAGYLAMPTGAFPDFRTDEGTQWYNDNSANPLFAIDHVSLTEGNTLNESQIDKAVGDALAEAQAFSLSVENVYNEANRELKVASKMTAVNDYSGELYLTVCLLEDSLVGRQVIPGGIDTAYVFRNVFRGTLNGADGERFVNGNVYVNDEFTKNHTLTLDEAYNADQCYILAYISDKGLGGKILQTAMEKIK